MIDAIEWLPIEKENPIMKTASVIARYLAGVIFLVFHALMAPSGLPLALFVAVLWAVIFVDVRPAFAGLFQPRLQARARGRAAQKDSPVLGEECSAQGMRFQP